MSLPSCASGDFSAYLKAFFRLVRPASEFQKLERKAVQVGGARLKSHPELVLYAYASCNDPEYRKQLRSHPEHPEHHIYRKRMEGRNGGETRSPRRNG